MILTILEATVAADRVPDLEAAFHAGEGHIPPGLVRTHLLCNRADHTQWRIETLWESAAALAAMRQQGGTPAGILMFRAAGAEPSLTLFDVAETLSADKE